MGEGEEQGEAQRVQPEAGRTFGADMSTIIVWKSETADGAELAGRILRGLPSSERENIYDVALASWPQDSSKPTTRVLDDFVSDQALGEAFWGVLFGLIFYSPLIGAAVVSATGAFSGSLADVGIDDTFVNRVRDAVTPGTSALFMVGADSLVDCVRGASVAQQPVKLLVTQFTRRQEGALRQVFAG
jgi:uncharacterized membrane protein